MSLQGLKTHHTCDVPATYFCPSPFPGFENYGTVTVELLQCRSTKSAIIKLRHVSNDTKELRFEMGKLMDETSFLTRKVTMKEESEQYQLLIQQYNKTTNVVLDMEVYLNREDFVYIGCILQGMETLGHIPKRAVIKNHEFSPRLPGSSASHANAIDNPQN